MPVDDGASPLIKLSGGGPAMAQVLAHRPELLERYQAFYQQLWRQPEIPARVLELCRLRIAQIHDAQAELAVSHSGCEISETERASLAAADFTTFTAAEQAALHLAEALPYNHHGLSDAQVAAAVGVFGEAGGVALLTALAFFDVTCRLKLVWDLPVETTTFSGETLT